MPDLRDWQDYVKAHPEILARAPMDPRQIADLTTKASLVVAHPGWQMFLDRLASRRALLVAQRARVERAILDGDGTGDAAKRLDLRHIQGEMAGLDFASGIIPDMMTEGEKLLREVSAGVKSGDAAQ